MSENVSTQRVLNQEEMAQLITIAQFAKLVGVSSSTVRKAGKKGEIPGCYHVMGTIGFNPEEAKGWSPPEGGSVRITRNDGRLLYNIALLPEELATLTGTYEIIDPRVEAAAKREARRVARAAKKAAEAAATVSVAVDTNDEEDVDDDDFFDDTDE